MSQPALPARPGARNDLPYQEGGEGESEGCKLVACVRYILALAAIAAAVLIPAAAATGTPILSG